MMNNSFGFSLSMTNSRRIVAKWISVLACLCINGCATGPDFSSPAPPKVDRYTTKASIPQTAATPVAGGEAQTFAAGEQTPRQWWTLFGSEQLNSLVNQAVKNNPNVARAQAALRQAQETLNAGYGNQYPGVDARLSGQRQKASGAVLGLPANSTSIFNLYNASVNVSYDLDIFGGVRRSLEAEKSVVEYQQFELQATYQTLAANVVTSAIAEASLRAQVAAAEDIFGAEEKQLKIVETQFELGSVSRAEVLGARSSLASTQASLVQLEKQLSARQNQLAAYLGKFPSEWESTGLALEGLTLPQNIPLTLPSELVRRRPDVRAAEALLHQASAQIGVATAAMFPKIALSAGYGAQSTQWHNLFDDNVWSLGAAITQPLFHAGTLAAQKRASIAAYDQAMANYRQTVLTAFSNVADTLNALDADARILLAQHNAMTAARGSLDLVQAQFKLGSTSYLELLISQRQYQQTRIAYLQALASRYQDTAALCQALSGSMTDEMPPDSPQVTIGAR